MTSTVVHASAPLTRSQAAALESAFMRGPAPRWGAFWTPAAQRAADELSDALRNAGDRGAP